MKVVKQASEIKACCASCNGSGYSGGVDGFIKITKMPKLIMHQHFQQKQKAA